MNAGLQMDLFNNKLSLTADIYTKYTKDLIYAVTLPTYSGYALVLDNIGDIRNKGIEINLSGKVLGRKKFNWAISGNWSSNSNKLVKSYSKLNIISNLYSNEEGREFNSYYMPVWMGVNSDNGKPQWKGADGKPTQIYKEAPKEFAGKMQPDGFGSIFNTFGWKGIELMCQLYYQYGGSIYNQAYNQLLNDGQLPYGNLPVEALDRWQKPGDVAANPRRATNNPLWSSQPSTRFLRKSDHLRFQTARISWQVPKRMTDNISIESLKVHIQGNNLAIWSTVSGVDPDAINPGGVAGLPYPMARTYSIGLNASF